MTDWQLVLGFEIHVELKTASKMFCSCPADHFATTPNTQTCPVCLGLPGALPVPNAKAIEWCVKLGLALGCDINLFSKFDRKNYFYPDLAKGYQISQYDQPFCHHGSLTLSSGKTIRITRVHMEEDTGKLQHAEVDGKKVSLIDFNRSGVPLVEIVTEPDFDNSDDGVEFLKEIQQIVRALDISTADMEKGSMRLEANISLRPKGQTTLPKYKVEVKNVNSFRFIKKSIDFEFTRQKDLLEHGQTPVQETRGFSENKGETVSQRSKEEANDYRYFPEPDIPPITFTQKQIDSWRGELPELPATLRTRLQSMGLSSAVASTLSLSPLRLKKFQELSKSHDPISLAKFLVNIPEDQVKNATMPEASSTNSNVAQITKVVKEIVAANPKAVADLKTGKTQSLFFLIGQVKRQLGNIDIELVKSTILSTV